ncbi:MAG TPA: UDP-N-acetylmuramoyl-L-alanyl-D-glutamate--2,6-diaminopimelate ligase [Xanthobacteraceae bacterium]|nr:UDP-N-acetylmuramoyl-L-alanyl-D-glutamate--2,6-diaminopimelate ligase [Xanthobacteraceae bacterium]
MKLRDILPDGATCDPQFGAHEITGVCVDSRQVKPGNLFVAVPGTKADGLAFVPQALAAGAAAIMAEQRTTLPAGIPLVQVANVRRALALTAARLHPRQPRTIAAVTGTSGKTSVAAFTRQIWAALGEPAASIGTVGVVSPRREVYGSLTTPDPIELHRTLDELAGEGVTHLALEASSHGLDQHRLDGVRVSVGGFTNLSRDHLDYHPSLEAYLAAKLVLFERLIVPNGTAVVSADHDEASAVIKVARGRGLRVLTVGSAGKDIRLVETVIDGFSQTLSVAYGARTYRVRLPLVGAFQVENALVAAGFAIATGSDPDAVFNALEGLKGAKGRLELVAQKNGAPIFVDYAHKPDALGKTLDALRPYVRGRLVLVFGAGGDRDRGKRELMGEIAAKKADWTIVTDDNPRTEEPAAIRRAILTAVPGATEIGDRREAIGRAVAELRPGDVLVIAGKGHESGQIVGTNVLPFSDHEAVTAALKESVR